MKTKERRSFAPETIDDLARKLAQYRLGGCPSGGGVAIQGAVRQVAKKHGRSYSELWALVHATAYEIIDIEIKI